MIDRAVRLAQATSSTTTVALLVAVNLIPLVGVLFFGWNVATLLALYWVENGIIGLLNIPKILLAEGPDASGSPAALLRSRGVPTLPRLVQAMFFLVHYGLFWFVHGIFVFTLPFFFAARGEPFDPGGLVDGRRIETDLVAVAIGAIGLAISHLVSFIVNFLGRQEYRRVSPTQQTQAPYGRLVILHVTIILGALVSLWLGSPVGAVIVLVLLKTVVDLRLHQREHERLATRPLPE